MDENSLNENNNDNNNVQNNNITSALSLMEKLNFELNKTIFRCKLLTLENEILKNVNDHLIKIIEETIKLVKTSEAKTL